MDHCPAEHPATDSDEAVGDTDDPAPRKSDEPYSRSSKQRHADDVKPSGFVTLTMDVEDCDPPAASWLIEQLNAALNHLELNQAHLAIRIVDDATMSRYHEQYCNLPGTTDVLTFDLRDPSQLSAPISGDLLLCIDEAARQAQKHGHSTREELLLYAVHGLMHLLGEDDHDEADYAAMHAREDALLEAIGVGRLFAKPQTETKDTRGAGVNPAIP